MLKKMSTLDATFVVLMAACGVALKPIVGPITKLIGSALFIPSGSIGGAVYMMWPTLAFLVVRRFGAASLVGIIEGIIIVFTGFYGSHGIISLLIYFIPCLIIDLSLWITQKFANRFVLFVAPALGNLSGSVMVGVFIMHIPTIPLIISLAPSFVFGGIGGLFAGGLYNLLIRSFPQFSKEKNVK